MATVIPSLSASSTDTWISSPLAKGRRILTNYLLTDRFQSHAYSDTVYSIVDILLEITEDEVAMSELVKRSLTSFFSLHFPKVDISVDMNLTKRELTVGITWFENNVPYSAVMNDIPFDTILSNVTYEHNYGDPIHASRYPEYN